MNISGTNWTLSPALRKSVVDMHNAYGTEEYNDKRNQLSLSIRRAKQEYKVKVGNLFAENKPREAWKGLKTLLGMDKKRKDPAIISTTGSADRLNHFYARFDNKDFSKEHQEIRERLSSAVQKVTISEDLVIKSIRKIDIKKATGPDKIGGKVIKGCMYSLLRIIHSLFELSLSTCTYPTSWKVGEIVPLEKKPLPQCDNDLRPVTLTAVMSKCLERVGLNLTMPYVESRLDPMQFAYLKGRSTNDAVVTVIHRIAEHLDKHSSHTARVLYIDFSSAFNTIQPHKMVEKLEQLQVPAFLQLWLFDYLTGRPQYVRTNHEVSKTLVLNAGAPQGCVLSPVLFVLYTNDMRWNTNNVFITKYADDTIIAGLVKADNIQEYKDSIDYAVDWCRNNFLELNVSKTREVIWDYRRTRRCDHENLVIDNMNVEISDSYKYLGLTMDNQFKFSEHVNLKCKNANSYVLCEIYYKT